MTTLTTRSRSNSEGIWVDARPFRAHLLHLVESSGADWQTIAEIARIPPTVAERLMFGRSGRLVRRITADNAWRLYRITPKQLNKLMAKGRSSSSGSVRRAA